MNGRISGRWQVALAPSQPLSPTGRTENLGEVPALDEVSGQVPGRWAMNNHPNVSPWHPRCGLPVNEIWGSQENQEKRSRMVSWRHLRQGGGGSEQREGYIILDPAHPFLSPSPNFCPYSQLLGTLEEGTLTLKRPVQLHPVLNDKIAVVFAQPEELVVREVWGGWRV